MRAVTVFYILFVWAQLNVAHEFKSWHEEVGIKNAEKIKRVEDNLSDSRIVGGTIAPIYNHPYLAGLLIDVGLASPSACGGSILSTRRILTAAHCWYDGRFQARQITVVLGTPYLFHGGVRIGVQAIAVHHGYDFRTFANDIAMLYFPEIRYSHAIQPIPLPSGSLINRDFTDKWVTASGYGRYSDSVNPTTNTMTRNVRLQVMSNEKCRSFYGGVILDSNICTHGIGGVGICQGDSGGPLTINEGGQEVLIGVSSFVARDGCELQFPSAFARVGNYLDWIRVQL